MGDPDITSSHLIGVEAPAVLLEFLDLFADILMVTNLHTDPFFYSNCTLCTIKKPAVKILPPNPNNGTLYSIDFNIQWERRMRVLKSSKLDNLLDIPIVMITPVKPTTEPKADVKSLMTVALKLCSKRGSQSPDPGHQ